MALWDCYLTPSDWRRPEISWLQGQEKERAEALVRPLWDAREKLWLDQKYLYCHVIAVHPNFQRRGIGELLFKFGADIAQQTRLPIYIESSREAERLYEKMDCKRLKEKPVHKSEDLWPDKGEPAREDQDVALFVWIPEYGESNVPRTVELAQ
jgi:GNAT superfamily N-acetyltransferase